MFISFHAIITKYITVCNKAEKIGIKHKPLLIYKKPVIKRLILKHYTARIAEHSTAKQATTKTNHMNNIL
jgi:hypothetical protein